MAAQVGQEKSFTNEEALFEIEETEQVHAGFEEDLDKIFAAEKKDNKKQMAMRIRNKTL